MIENEKLLKNIKVEANIATLKQRTSQNVVTKLLSGKRLSRTYYYARHNNFRCAVKIKMISYIRGLHGSGNSNFDSSNLAGLYTKYWKIGKYFEFFV